MKLSKSLLQSIAVGVTLGVGLTACSKEKAGLDQNLQKPSNSVSPPTWIIPGVNPPTQPPTPGGGCGTGKTVDPCPACGMG